jgi:PPOX class probable F420-dependent enzyme
MAADLSPDLQKLLNEAAYCQVATLMPDGSPQISQTWVDTDGTHILINTFEGSQKVRNLRRDSRVAVNVVDPANPYRIANLRGRVTEITADGADAQVDRLAFKYLGQEKYPFHRPDRVRLIVRIVPERINSIGLD